jgi:hypothetical protein
MGFIKDMFNTTETAITKKVIENKLDNALSYNRDNLLNLTKNQLDSGTNLIISALNVGFDIVDDNKEEVVDFITNNKNEMQELQTMIIKMKNLYEQIIAKPSTKTTLDNIKANLKKSNERLETLNDNHIKNSSETADAFIKEFGGGKRKYFIFDSENRDRYIEVTPEHYQQRLFNNKKNYGGFHYSISKGFNTIFREESRVDIDDERWLDVKSSESKVIKSPSDIEI